MTIRALAASALASALFACGNPAPPPQEAQTTASETTSPGTAAPAGTAASPQADALAASVGGVAFRVVPGWTLVTEGNMSIAKSPSGDAGFVVAGFDDPSEGPNALHRADKEFATSFPVGLGSPSRQLPLGTLPYGFVLNQSESVKGDRLVRLSVLMGRGVKTKHLVVLAYVNLPKANAEAEGERIGRVFETIFQTFAPAS